MVLLLFTCLRLSTASDRCYRQCPCPNTIRDFENFEVKSVNVMNEMCARPHGQIVTNLSRGEDVYLDGKTKSSQAF